VGPSFQALGGRLRLRYGQRQPGEHLSTWNEYLSSFLNRINIGLL
jgi:hypothetical protein